MSRWKLGFAPAVVAILTAAAVAGCGSNSSGGTSSSSGGASASSSKKTYDIYLSNSYLGEGWRTQMVKSAEAVLTKDPLKGRANLTVVNSDKNTPSSQIASLNNIILKKPDAIVIDPSSPPALKPVLERACTQHILVVALDQPVTASCAYNVHMDFKKIGEQAAGWLAKTLHGKGKVLVDQGLPGSTVSTDLMDGYMSVIKQNPGMSVAAKFTSQFAPGPEQQAVASLLSAHSDVAGVISQGYVSGSFSAFKNAGRKLVPFAAFGYNGPMSDCATQKGATCFLAADPPWQSASAVKIAIDVLDGKTQPRDQVLPSACFITNDVSPDGESCEAIKVGTNTFPKLSPDIVFPVSPPWTKPALTVHEATGL
jgi:ribose transport system substrate-binding protein